MDKLSPKMKIWLKRRGYNPNIIEESILIRSWKLSDPYWEREFNKWIMSNHKVKNILISALKSFEENPNKKERRNETIKKRIAG